MSARKPSDGFTKALLAWYDGNARAFPWRVPPQKRDTTQPDPYEVWLSEIMLQQTTTTAVIPYFERFIARWPTVCSLAEAPLENVLAAWAGLGYYRRAHLMHICARQICENGGRFPETEAELRALPGIGPYTAGAILSIAFNQPVAVVDGNIERILARVFTLEKPVKTIKKDISSHALALTSKTRPGDHVQAMMDLGATVCTPRSPHCPQCPVSTECEAHRRELQAQFPIKPKRRERPIKFGAAFVLVSPQGIWLQQRPYTGLLAGMAEVPGTPWQSANLSDGEHLAMVPCAGKWTTCGEVEHTFTHFHLCLRIFYLRLSHPLAPKGKGWWAPLETLEDAALPSLMRKVLQEVGHRAPVGTLRLA